MKLSIIVPAHNEQDNIIEVINRIENSVYIPHELVLVNDHSTDKTPELVDKLSKQYNNIRLVANKLDKGFANAIKTSFVNATGDVVLPVLLGEPTYDIANVFKMYSTLLKMNFSTDLTDKRTDVHGLARRVIRENP